MSNSPDTVKPVTIGRKDAAHRYGVSAFSIDQAIASGEVRAKRLGKRPSEGERDRRRVLIYLDSLDDWIERQDDA